MVLTKDHLKLEMDKMRMFLELQMWVTAFQQTSDENEMCLLPPLTQLFFISISNKPY